MRPAQWFWTAPATVRTGQRCRTPAYCIQQGKIDGALTFNGTTDYVNVGNVIGSGAYTKIAWVKRDAGNYYNNIISSGDVFSHAFTHHITYSFKLSAGHVNPFNAVQDPTPLDVNVWYFVAVTFDPCCKLGQDDFVQERRQGQRGQ